MVVTWWIEVFFCPWPCLDLNVIPSSKARFTPTLYNVAKRSERFCS